MTPEERRALIEQPIPSVRRLFATTTIGSKTSAGHFRDDGKDVIYRRYVKWLERHKQNDDNDGEW
jgi:hypothetical protein